MLSHSKVAAIAVVALLTTAGCTANQSATANPQSSQTPAPTQPLQEDHRLNATEIAQTHVDTLNETAFQKIKYLHKVGEAPTVIEHVEYINDTTWLWVLSGDGPGAGFGQAPGQIALKTNGSTVDFYRQTEDNKVAKGIHQGINGSASPSEALNSVVFEESTIKTLLGESATNQVELETDRTLVAGTIEQASIGGDVVTGVEYTVVIAESGIVETITARYTADGERYQLTVQFEPRTQDRITPPEWLNQSQPAA